jgi:hypothetical protein
MGLHSVTFNLPWDAIINSMVNSVPECPIDLIKLIELLLKLINLQELSIINKIVVESICHIRKAGKVIHSVFTGNLIVYKC